MKHKLQFTLASILLLASAPAVAGTLPVGTCMNMGNHLESPDPKAWGGENLGVADFRAIKAAGFQTVRIPVKWSIHSNPKPPYTVDPDFFKIVDQRVNEALGSGLNVILNSHFFDIVDSDPEQGGPALAAVWAQIAARYAHLPENKLWFEIENEPHDKLTNKNLIATLGLSLDAIRKVSKTRSVVIGGEGWSSLESLATLELPSDDNLYPTFHYYEPFDFTHQGATWVGPVPPLGRMYGSDADKARLIADVAKMKAYIARTGKTPFMGEVGAYDIIPLPERVKYHRAVHDAWAPTGIGMCMWAYTNTFTFYDQADKTWRPGMLEAIGLGASNAPITSSVPNALEKKKRVRGKTK